MASVTRASFVPKWYGIDARLADARPTISRAVVAGIPTSRMASRVAGINWSRVFGGSAVHLSYMRTNDHPTRDQGDRAVLGLTASETVSTSNTSPTGCSA
jgi:hypothetical protein